ncbi:clarin-2 [Leucoraja erinacea]|uniref:clarin-2 n=1 Tax=Leucoraja erinaceus TaxID=7782 RepID=UPI00245637FA|nr:clarin-2 [Leucoraja erinacea]XP_055494663.1 clarin-2 [Leucoraja erinacea]
MPNLLKKVFFSIAAVVSFISAILLTVALGTTRWVTGTILCKTGAEIVNATDPEMAKFTGSLHYGLFRGRKIRKCGLGGRDSEITIFPQLVKTLNTAVHVLVVLFICLAIAFAMVSFGFCVYNAVKIPYQAMKGTMGIYLWNVFASICGVSAVVCFFAAVKLHRHTERIANFREQVFKFVILQEYFDSSFWICVASPVVHVVNMLVVRIGGIQFPTFKTKTEEAKVTPEVLMY